MASSRKKACQPCSDAKLRCDRPADHQFCIRCEKRGITHECQINANTSTRSSRPGTGQMSEINSTRGSHQLQRIPTSAWSSPGDFDGPRKVKCKLDFSNIDLICMINPEDVRNKWLKPWTGTDFQSLKTYPPSMVQFMSQIFNGYSWMPIRQSEFPPFVHHAQYKLQRSEALVNCLALARLLEKSTSDASSLISKSLLEEMDRIRTSFRQLHNFEMLGAFQAYLLYAFFVNYRIHDGKGTLPEVMASLQDIAAEVVRKGTTCAAEITQTRPRWEDWIVAEASRRTLYTMYMFDSVLCDRDNLPNFMATELQGTLAPTSKALWQAEDRDAWSLLYDQHIVRWGREGPLKIDELWPRKSELSLEERDQCRERIDLWTSDMDEFNTMLFAVTTCTHGLNTQST